MGVWSDQRASAQLVIVAENWWHRVPAFRPFSSRPISNNHPSIWRPFLDGEEEEPSNFQKACTCSRLSGMFSVFLCKCCSFAILPLTVSTGWLNHHWVTPVYHHNSHQTYGQYRFASFRQEVAVSYSNLDSSCNLWWAPEKLLPSLRVLVRKRKTCKFGDEKV